MQSSDNSKSCISKEIGAKNTFEIASNKYPFVGIFAFLLMVLTFCNPPCFATQQDSPKNVIILAAYKPTSPVAYQWDSGVRSVFENDAVKNIKMYSCQPPGKTDSWHYPG